LRARPQREQLDAFAVDRERLEREHVLAGEVQPLAAGDEEGSVRSAVEPAADARLGKRRRVARSCRG
jgi:hypothetical protein